MSVFLMGGPVSLSRPPRTRHAGRGTGSGAFVVDGPRVTTIGSILHGAYGDYYEQLVCLKAYKRAHPGTQMNIKQNTPGGPSSVSGDRKSVV